MSELYLPPNVRRQVAAERAIAARKKAAQDAGTDFEPYYSELPKIKAAGDKLNRIFAFAGEEPWTERQYETAARNLFGEAGFEISLEWMQAMDPQTGEALPLKVPSVTITGRVKKETERDHDRLKHEITAGLADGQPGYIREDGSRREDPIKKTIV